MLLGGEAYGECCDNMVNVVLCSSRHVPDEGHGQFLAEYRPSTSSMCRGPSLSFKGFRY